MVRRLTIPGRLPGLNEIIADARTIRVGVTKTGRRYEFNRYQEVLKKWKQHIAKQALHQTFRPVEEPSWFTFLLFEPHRKRDPDNICSGARKIVLDALQDLGLLPGDDWRWIKGLASYWEVDKENPRVVVMATSGWMSKEQAMLLEEHSNGKKD